MTIIKHGGSRYWAVYDDAHELVCVCVYKKGAAEVKRRLEPNAAENVERTQDILSNSPRAAPRDRHPRRKTPRYQAELT